MAKSETIRIGLAASPATLDPRFATDATSYRISRLIFLSLVDFNDRLRPLPSLATWQRLAPNLYRFTLRNTEQRFHDSSELTAEDVKATYDSVLNPATGSPHRNSVNMIQRIDIVSKHALNFYLSRPDPLFPDRLVIGILPKRLAARERVTDRSPPGSGPFRVVAWPNENRLILSRIADNQTIEFLRVPDPTVRALKLVRHELDLLQGDLTPEIFRWLETQAEVTVERENGDALSYLGFNMQDPVVGRRDVREAIACAIDRTSILRYILAGAAHPGENLLPQAHWASAVDQDLICENNPQRAHTLVMQAEQALGKPLSISFKTSKDPMRLRIATVIQDQLDKVGIKLTIRSYDWATFYADIKAGRFQMFGLQWVGLKMPDIFRYAFHSSMAPPHGANRGRFANAEIDGLIELAEGTENLATQDRIYSQIQTKLLQELAYVPLWYTDNMIARRRELNGYHVTTDGNFDGLVNAQITARTQN